MGTPALFDMSQAQPIEAQSTRTAGMKVGGNIDVSQLPAVPNPDGSVSTVRSMSIGTDQGEVLIPTVVNGRVVSNDEAIQNYRQTGKHLGIFDTPANATAYAQSLHQSEARRVGAGNSVLFDMTKAQPLPGIRTPAEEASNTRQMLVSGLTGMPTPNMTDEEKTQFAQGKALGAVSVPVVAAGTAASFLTPQAVASIKAMAEAHPFAAQLIKKALLGAAGGAGFAGGAGTVARHSKTIKHLMDLLP